MQNEKEKKKGKKSNLVVASSFLSARVLCMIVREYSSSLCDFVVAKFVACLRIFIVIISISFLSLQNV